MKYILSEIPVKASRNDKSNDASPQPHIIIQVSSVASMGEQWLSSTLLPVLSTTRSVASQDNVQRNLGISKGKVPKPTFSIVFPTADEVRRSVDGYGAGASIHMKTQTPAQAKQLSALRSMLCHWGGDAPSNTSAGNAAPVRVAGRKRAAPHIKTYIRFSDQSMTKIDWAMVTSANLSTQAWGSAESATGEVRICSYEIGVVIWPALWEGKGEEKEAQMVPTFGSDTPTNEGSEREDEGKNGEEKRVVGWRMPYDLPPVPYGIEEMPWCATQPYDEPDWMGRVWPGYGN